MTGACRSAGASAARCSGLWYLLSTSADDSGAAWPADGRDGVEISTPSQQQAPPSPPEEQAGDLRAVNSIANCHEAVTFLGRARGYARPMVDRSLFAHAEMHKA